MGSINQTRRLSREKLPYPELFNYREGQWSRSLFKVDAGEKRKKIWQIVSAGFGRVHNHHGHDAGFPPISFNIPYLLQTVNFLHIQSIQWLLTHKHQQKTYVGS